MCAIFVDIWLSVAVSFARGKGWSGLFPLYFIYFSCTFFLIRKFDKIAFLFYRERNKWLTAVVCHGWMIL